MSNKSVPFRFFRKKNQNVLKENRNKGGYMNKIINKRIFLEKRYSNYCLYYKIPLPEIGNRVVAISPTAYFYHTGIRENGIDSKEFKELNLKAHFGLRKKIEEEVEKILNINDYSVFGIKYFFELKNILINLSHIELNKYLRKIGLKQIKKDKYNRILKLFRRWAEESFKCHYKITGAKKRIHRKLKNIKN